MITVKNIVLSDYNDTAGKSSGHYFHQDLLVAQFIYKKCPVRHIDVGSRIDGFVAHLATFREVDVVDYRPLPESVHDNIKFIQADAMIPQKLGKTDSLSCLHALEHFGLGRYSDPIDTEGHRKALSNFIGLLNKGGRLYISFPISRNNEIHFNAHRVFNPLWILGHPEILAYMKLVRFDYVDDSGDLHLDVSPSSVEKSISYGCGIYTLEKT